MRGLSAIAGVLAVAWLALAMTLAQPSNEEELRAKRLYLEKHWCVMPVEKRDQFILRVYVLEGLILGGRQSDYSFRFDQQTGKDHCLWRRP